MSDWTAEAAWLVMPGGVPKMHPQTRVESVPGGYRLHAHKLNGWFIEVTPDEPLGRLAAQRLAEA